MLSITTIRDAMASPQASRQGFSNEMFDFGKDHPYLVFASNTFQNCLIPIMVNGNPLFKIEAPEEVGAPFRLSGELYDSKGIKSLFIKENEWRAFNSNWDIETIGPKITIRESSSELSLVLRLMPPDGIVIEKVKMLYENWFFEGDAVTLKANGASLSANNVTNSNVGFYFG